MTNPARLRRFALLERRSGCSRLIIRYSIELFLIGFLFACQQPSAGADPLATLKAISAFPTVDLNKLYAGEIAGEPGSPMKFRNGISAETCFAVPVAAAEAAKRLQLWDPSLRGTVKTLEFYPVNNPCTAADFNNLSLKAGIKPQRWLLEKTAALSGRKSELNLTRDEARQLSECVKARPDPQTSSACWAKLLLERATLFQERGFGGILPYEAAGETVLPAEQVRAMLGERPSLAREFAPLLEQCGLLKNGPGANLKPFHYWGLYEANHHATLTLGAVYLLALADRFQLLDVQYYVSGTYYTFVTLYEVWPIQVGGKPAALIWRGDFFSTPTLAYTRGVERLAYGAFMLQELKKTIRSFQSEILKPIAERPQ